YLWAGNVRELKNTIERMVVLSSGNQLTVDDLPEEIRRPGQSVAGLINLPEAGVDLEGIEKQIVLAALERNDWKQTAAARYLNITGSMLISRMEKYNLTPPGRKNEPADPS